MVTLNYGNLLKMDKSHGLSEDEFSELKGNISKYLDKIENRGQGFYKLPDDLETAKEIENYAKKVDKKYSDIVVLGIGGSALGTICLQKSLKHLFENELIARKNPRLHVLDNIDPRIIDDLEDIIDYKDTLFIVVSKSGTTPETVSLYLHFREIFKKARLDLSDHFVFITGEKGFLREQSLEHNIKTFKIPDNVGGRFSVLTAVGLLPAKLIGIDIHGLLEGAGKMRKFFMSKDLNENLPYKIALMQYLLSKKGKIINVMMPYSQKLLYFSDWYRQLLAESIGKKEDVGLTPVKALGVTDQHSQSQLYNDGPNDKFLIFINVEDPGPEITIPEDDSIEYLKDITFGRLLHTEMEGTIQSLTKNNRPNITISIPRVDAHYLGQLFMLFEAATAFLGEFYEINAFNQPGVELSKKITKELLAK
jgi:glucose-6-phosphate isomerase